MHDLKKMLLIFNPRAGTQKFPPQLFEVLDCFSAAGYLVTAYATQDAGEVGAVVSAHMHNYDCLVCSGGDGTIAEAVEALMKESTRPCLGIIPAGTVNDFATSLGLPGDIVAAARAIVTSAAHFIDIGRFNGRCFSYVAAFGKFTDVSYTTPQSVKNIFGKLAYFLEGMKQAVALDSYPCEFILDGERVAGDFVLGIIANAHSIAGYKLPEEMDVQINDGYFEVILIHRPSSIFEIQKILSSLLTQEIKTDLMVFRKARQIHFQTPTPIPWTLDGDYGGDHAKATIINQQRAIEVIY